jgi:hypothetical protein
MDILARAIVWPVYRRYNRQGVQPGRDNQMVRVDVTAPFP